MNISPISLRNVMNSSPDLILLIDISDALLFLQNNKHVSGIQRVQLEVLHAVYKNHIIPIENVHIVKYDSLENDFEELEKELFFKYIAEFFAVSSGKSKEQLAVNTYVKSKKLTLIKSPGQQCVLLMPGTAWVFDSYFIAVRRLQKKGVQYIPVIHDMIPCVVPQYCHRGVVDEFSIHIRKLLRHADAIFAVSESTKRDIIDFCQKNSYSCPEIFVMTNASTDLAKQISVSPLLDYPYVLMVGTLEARKNHLLAVKIWEKLAENHGKDIPKLVFVGKEGWSIEPLLDELRTTAFAQETVKIFSDISDTDLASLYRHCVFTLFPSFYEGWGLPVDESLSFGKLCLASDTSSMPEVGGHFCVYFSPDNFEDAYNKVEKYLFDNTAREEKENYIREQYTATSWEDVTKKYLAFMQTVAPTTVSHPPVCVKSNTEYFFKKYPQPAQISSLNVLQDEKNTSLFGSIIPMDQYIISEDMLSDRTIVYDAEYFERWTHISGTSLQFSVDGIAETLCILYLRMRVPPQYLPVTINVYHGHLYMESFSFSSKSYLLRLNLKPYISNNIVDITMKIVKDKNITIPNQRDLGIGLIEAFVVPQEDCASRLTVLEKIGWQL